MRHWEHYLCLRSCGGGGTETLNGLSRPLGQPFGRPQAADVAPVPRLVDAVMALRQPLAELTARWRSLRDTDLAALNRQLRRAGLPAIVAGR